jgi:hypothetical protein
MRTFNKIIGVCLLVCINVTIASAGVTLPSIPTTQFSISNYGALTSSLDNSTAINAAITAANAAGGGTVVIPDSTYLSGSITMKSNVNLYISSGAILQMMPYGSGNGSPTGSYPNNGTKDQYANFIYGSGLSNIEISGTGTIEGNGTDWWTAYDANSAIKRPCMIRFKACSKVLITGITVRNAPNVHITLGQSSSYGSNGTISNVTIYAPSTSPNTDAIDIWYWDGVDIHNCNLSEGDDNVAIDSYSTNISVKNCTFGTGHGMSVGSYTIGVHNVTVDSCTFNGTTNGIRLKSNNTRGGQDSTFSYSNITMTNVKYPFYITSWYDSEPYPASAQTAGTVTSTTPIWKNITFKNITVTNSTYAGIIYGLPEAYIKNVVFDNVQLAATTKGLIANFIDSLIFKNCSSITIPSSKGNAVVYYDATIAGINTTSGVSTSCSSSSVNENKIVADRDVICFPNPLEGNDLTIKADDQIKKIKIYTQLGTQVFEVDGNKQSDLEINTSNIPLGYYVLKVSLINGQTRTLKLVKK